MLKMGRNWFIYYIINDKIELKEEKASMRFFKYDNPYKRKTS